MILFIRTLTQMHSLHEYSRVVLSQRQEFALASWWLAFRSKFPWPDDAVFENVDSDFHFSDCIPGGWPS